MANKIKHILIIDDDEISNFITQSILEQSGKVKDISVVLSSDEGIDFLRGCDPNNLPDLIMLDIKMPVKSGWDFLADLKSSKVKTFSDMIIVMLSSSVYPDDVHKANSFKEVSGYYPKPITLAKVEAIIEKYF